MFTLKNYIRPQSVKEAYELCLKKQNVVVGGMLWLKMSHKSYDTAIDISSLGVDKIEKKDGYYHIGACVTLRQLEKNAELNALTGGVFEDALKNIVGVQFRNSATVGGSIYGRFGFSDVITVFSVLDAQVSLYNAGVMSLAEFMKMPAGTRDILTEIIIPDKKIKAAYEAVRNTATDFAVLNCAVSYDGEKIKCAAGARPFAAQVFEFEHRGGIDEKTAAEAGNEIAGKAAFGSNMRGSSAYRKKICPVLVRRAIMKIAEAQ